MEDILINKIITNAPMDEKSNTSDDMAEVSKKAIAIVKELVKN
ncbi:hypothetical protein [Clostridium sp. BJN0001]|nr:hypothetical protein [Clostridium sp. BJN0001]